MTKGGGQQKNREKGGKKRTKKKNLAPGYLVQGGGDLEGKEDFGSL